jgi:hypothetical protein
LCLQFKLFDLNFLSYNFNLIFTTNLIAILLSLFLFLLIFLSLSFFHSYTITVSAAYDWVKNCACIADFYQSMDKQQIAALALSSAQKVLQEKVILKSTATGGGGGGGVTEQDCIDLNCEIKKKWIKLDMKMMKIAFEVETERVLALDRGEPFAPPTYENDLDDLHMFQEPGSEIPDKKQCVSASSDVILEGAVVDQSTSSVTTLKEVRDSL